MTFIIVLIALMLERFFHWHHLRHWNWFIQYERWLSLHLGQVPTALRLCTNILPPLIIVGGIGFLLAGRFYGIFEFLFGTVILLYCIGPDNLWVQVYKSLQELHKEDPTTAVEHVKKAFGISSPDNSTAFHETFVRAIFIAAHERIFSVVFWFIILGPLGAVLYRLIELLSRRPEFNLVPQAIQIKNVLDWLPIRVFTFLFALGGHFTQVFSRWKQGFFTQIDSSETLLADCGIAALATHSGKALETGHEEKQALELLDRVLVIGLVILAMTVLIM